jgi:hypothetical protein
VWALHGGGNTAPVDDFVLALEEACTNAIRHSGSRRDIEIRSSFEGDDQQREELGEAFMAFDWEHRLVCVNEATVSLVGKTRGELIGRRTGGIWPAPSADPVTLAMREAMELGKPSVVEFRAAESGDRLEARVCPTSAGVSMYAREIGE